ncbi:MAG TPA: S-layer homology domain-containing protein, partial [Candidatus Sulfotelmatobacter sp.]|nr:S-layer homology domain-containing protein [Candidatus Sulfotelmatobacter sp.]
PVTRGEFATWLARIKNFPVPRLDKDVFFDVPKEHWRAPYVKLAVDAGYMKSYPNNTFGLDDPISRREAAGIAVQVEGTAIIEKIKTMFRDVPQTERGATPIYTARDKGLVVGLSDKTAVYDPERALTRAEAAMLLSRFAEAQAGFRDLFDFESGYTREHYCALNIPPEILAFTVEPSQVGRKEKTTLKLKARIAPRAKFSPLAKVKVDLSQLGGLPDAEMFDDATHGDETAGDLTYSLNTSFQPLEAGEKTLRVTATDKLGWEGKAESPLLIVE